VKANVVNLKSHEGDEKADAFILHVLSSSARLLIMKAHFFLLALLIVPALTPHLTLAENAKPAKMAAVNPSLVPIQDVAGLPRVLIIGDSISMGYTLPVRERLKEVANVHRIPQNGGPTKNGLANIERWLGSSKWDVIHFNWGIHDLKFMPDGRRQVEPADYEANLRALVVRMKKSGAKLIWATTTPIPKGPLIPPREFGEVAEYNRIAEKVMKENNVRINDLNTWITPKLGEMQKPQDVHYHDSGSDYLAEKVVEEIQAALKED
jgi:lysophospholipase L1-like esterase